MMIFPEIATYLTGLSEEIPAERRDRLDALSAFIAHKRRSGETARLIFICTHNSRRSHFGQVWAQVAAHYCGIQSVECYSGGTETTACNPRTVAALERAGIRVSGNDPNLETPKSKYRTDENNPVYRLGYAEEAPPIVAFSKVYDQPPNPASGFAAVMTCSQAEENCPFVPGAERRFSITYEDPKQADDTPEETDVYDARCRQIATEMLYVFRAINL